METQQYGNASFSLVSTNVSNGYRAQRIEATNLPSSQIVAISQLEPVVSGKPFQLSGKFRVEQLSGAIVQLYVDFYDQSRFLSTQSMTLPSETASDYVTISGEECIPANTSSARVYALVRSNVRVKQPPPCYQVEGCFTLTKNFFHRLP